MLKYFKHPHPVKFFLCLAVCIEILLNVVTPPLQAPDEFSHFYRAYQVSEGQLLPVKSDQRLGGYIPQGLIDFASQHRNSAYNMEYTLDHREIFNSCKIKLQEGERQFQDFANTSYYSPVSYLPQALALFVIRLFSENMGVLYYGSRLFTFLVWLICMAFVIKTVPVFKWLFTFLILLPMNPYIVNSFSADTVTNILSFLLIALILRHVFVTEKIKFSQLLLLGIIAALLVLAKVVYIGLILLLLLIPAKKYGKSWIRIVVIGSVFIVSTLLMLYWSRTIMTYYIPIKDYNPAFKNVASLSPCGDYYAQKAYILNHGLYFFKVIFRSLFSHPNTYLTGYIGVFGNGVIGMPSWFYLFAYVMIIVVAICEKNSFHFSLRQKLLMFPSALLAYVLLLLSQHLIWDCVGEGIVDLIQGRYLVPVFPLLFLCLQNKSSELKFNMRPVVMSVLLFGNMYGCGLIYQRFFKGNPAEVHNIYCDAEELDPYGAFKTSDPSVLMVNGNNISNMFHHSGNHSALLSPASPFCFTYKFKGLHPGDLIELEAWEKGEGALLVISGSQPNCGEFYFGGTYRSFAEAGGWHRIKNAYQVRTLCDSLNVSIYAWNPGKKNVYIDDINVKLTKFKSPPASLKQAF